MTDADANPLETAEAFSSFYERHADRLLRFFARRVYEPQTAMDLTAETFAQAFISRARFRTGGEREAGAWLQVIANRQLARYFRKGRAERRALRRLGLEVPRLSAEDASEVVELAGLADLRTVVRRGLSDLSDQHREALLLRIAEERPYREVAERLGISEQAARARVSRGLKALAVAIDNDAELNEVTA